MSLAELKRQARAGKSKRECRKILKRYGRK